MQKLYRFSINVVKVLTLLLAVMLFASGFLATCYADNMETQQVLSRLDNPLWNLLGICGYLAVFAGVLWIFQKAASTGKLHSRFPKLLLLFTLGLIVLLGAVLVLFGRTVPAADALSVYNAAAELAIGNTSVIHPTDSYLSYYPQQVGLMAFLEVLIRLWNLTRIDMPAWHFIKLVYVVLLCIAVYFQYRSIGLLWRERAAQISCCYLVLTCCNLPMIMYSSFVYGEIPSFTAFSIGAYLLLRLVRRDTASVHSSIASEAATFDAVTAPASTHAARRLGYGIGSVLFLALSVMLRKNSLILIIAVVLVLLCEALQQNRELRERIGLIALTVCIGLSSVGILPLVQSYYEHRAGSTLSSGVTATSYFAMGMQEASRGCGWYNGFNIETYEAAGMDTALANKISREAIGERLTYFREHPGYAADFYLHKHLSQWADGTYASRQATLATYGGRSSFFQSLYEGSGSRYYIGWCNAWQNALYLGVLLYCLGAVFRRGAFRDVPLYTYLGLIGVLGGFLFHILWEANSRYIFLYSLLLMPYCAAGICELLARLAARHAAHR